MFLPLSGFLSAVSRHHQYFICLLDCTVLLISETGSKSLLKYRISNV